MGDNMRDMSKKGRTRSGRERLSKEDVRNIRRLAEDLSQKEIAARYEISPSAICMLLKGQRWKNV